MADLAYYGGFLESAGLFVLDDCSSCCPCFQIKTSEGTYALKIQDPDDYVSSRHINNEIRAYRCIDSSRAAGNTIEGIADIVKVMIFSIEGHRLRAIQKRWIEEKAICSMNLLRKYKDELTDTVIALHKAGIAGFDLESHDIIIAERPYLYDFGLCLFEDHKDFEWMEHLDDRFIEFLGKI